MFCKLRPTESQEVQYTRRSSALLALKFLNLKAATYETDPVEAVLQPTQLAVCVDHRCMLLIHPCDCIRNQKNIALVENFTVPEQS